MFIISGFWVVDVLIYIKVLIVYNIIIYIVYFVYIILLGLFLIWSLIFVKYFILLMIDVIMLRNNYDLVEVLIFLKKKGVYDFIYIKYILYVRINDKK